MVATGRLPERPPGLDGDLAVGFGREIENDFGGVDVGIDARAALSRAPIIHPIVQVAQARYFLFGVPGDPLAAISESLGQGAKRCETPIRVEIVAFDQR